MITSWQRSSLAEAENKEFLDDATGVEIESIAAQPAITIAWQITGKDEEQIEGHKKYEQLHFELEVMKMC